MRNCNKLMAVLTAVLMLGGCANNGGSSVTETDPTSETVSKVNSTAETTAEISAPEQGGASQEAASGEPAAVSSGVEGEAAQNPGAGVDLVSGEYSENSLIFDLNGKYCDVSELPFSVRTYLPDFWGENLALSNACGGKLILGKRLRSDENGVPISEGQAFYTYDFKTGTLTEIFNTRNAPMPAEYPGAEYSVVQNINDTYTVYTVISEYREIIVAENHTTGKTVFTLANDNEKYWINSNSALIVGDYLYFDGTYYIPEFKKTIPVIFSVDLANGEIDILCSGMSEPRYGVANVCFKIESPNPDVEFYTNLRGEVFDGRYDKLRGVAAIFADTYFPIDCETLYDEYLGSREKICWIDKFEESHEIGTTGFNYELDIYFNSYNAAHITRDGIYLLELARYELENPSTINSTFRYLIGRYDEETGENTAALIESDGNDYVFVENTAIYIVDPDTLETMVLSM